MQYANVNGIKSSPSPKLKGKCYCCGSEVIAKCGSFKIWHWTHKDLKSCDPWWENETEWHRQWKNSFPKENQEIVHFDQKTREKHIADVKTNNGVVIEFQNSPMSIEELESRESFYGNMIWIINGSKFKNRFFIYDKLPKPDSVIFKDHIFQKRTNLSAGGFYTKPLNYEGKIVRPIYPIREIEKEIERDYRGHHLYHWSNPREVWLKSKKRVFIDFGEEELFELFIYKEYLRCIFKWNKEMFINRAIRASR
ncbi:competence protein CoiA [Sphingobacterium faecium]|uniref:competence protein CoiA n=1 Tax=Sphingobacterium faecium TaxID=34087 RepID=UPI00320B9583